MQLIAHIYFCNTKCEHIFYYDIHLLFRSAVGHSDSRTERAGRSYPRAERNDTALSRSEDHGSANRKSQLNYIVIYITQT